MFAQGVGNILDDPANSRLVLRFKHAGSVTRDATNAVVPTTDVTTARWNAPVVVTRIDSRENANPGRQD